MEKSMTKTNKHILDATDQSVGRLASAAAMILMGKNSATYTANVDSGHKVVITNASKVKFSGKKLEQKQYLHHSMYPGGLKRTPLKKVIQKDPTKVIVAAIRNMLPKNHLRPIRLSRVTFK